jgi:hypothetical protein
MITYYDCQTKKFFGDIDDEMKRAILGFYHGTCHTYSSLKEKDSKRESSFDLLRATKTEDAFIIEMYGRSGWSNLALSADTN